jgi:hypothetical protein
VTVDFEAICNALAARFEPGTIGTPSGAPAMREVYAKPPKSVPTVPAVILSVQDGSVVPASGQWKHEMNIDVVFLLSKRPADPVRVEVNRRKWLPLLLAATVGQWKLGLGAAVGYEMKSALPGPWEWMEYDVAGESFDAIRVGYTVTVLETVSPVP